MGGAGTDTANGVSTANGEVTAVGSFAWTMGNQSIDNTKVLEDVFEVWLG